MQLDAAECDKYFLFSIGDTAFSVSLQDVFEVLFIAELSLKSSKAYGVEGYLNRRGEPLPVYQLAQLLSLPKAKSGLYDHILVVNLHSSGLIGLITSGVKRIVECPIGNLVKLSEAKAAALYADQLLPEGASFLPVLSLSRLDAILSGSKDSTATPEALPYVHAA